MELKDVFDSPDKDESQGEPVQQAQPAQEQQPAANEQAATDNPADAPPASEDAPDGFVKRSVMEAVRNDWKGKAEREAGANKELRERLAQLERQQQAYQQQQPQQPQEPYDPERARMSDKLDLSEVVAREKYGDEVVDEAYQKFQILIQKYPGLQQKVMTHKHPWGALVQETKRMALVDEMGEDPDAYIEKKVAERLAKANPAPAPAAPTINLPQSLAGARSVSTRDAPVFNGPTPLGNILNR